MSKDPRVRNTVAFAITAWLTSITTVPGALIRIRNCVGEGNYKAFSRFIFYHALMCTWLFLIIAKLFFIEYAYVLERHGGIPAGFSGHADFMMSFIVTRPELFFFQFVTFFTSLALVLFSININIKYARNLTMNEEFKFEGPMRYFSAKMDRVISYLDGKPEIPAAEFEKVKRDVAEAESWTAWYRRAYLERSYLRELLVILFF